MATSVCLCPLGSANLMEGIVRLVDLEYSGKEGVMQDEDILQHWLTMKGGRYSKNIDF